MSKLALLHASPPEGFIPLPSPRQSSKATSTDIPKLRDSQTQTNVVVFFNTRSTATESSPVKCSETQTDSISSTSPLVSELNILRNQLSKSIDVIDRLFGLVQQMELCEKGAGYGFVEHDTRSQKDAEEGELIDLTTKDEDIVDNFRLPDQNRCAAPGPFTLAPGATSANKHRSPQRKRPVIGCAPSDFRFKASKTVCELFITNVNRMVTIADALDFLNPKATVLGISLISHPNARSKSFVLTVPMDERYSLLDPMFWPSGVEARDFVRPRIGRLAAASL
jgi:hypothetical protein